MNEPEKSLRPLAFIIGEWAGEGQSFGQPIKGHLQAKRRFQNTFIQIEEKLFLPDGSLDYEDCSWIGLDPAQNRLSVTHFMAPATIERKLLLLNETGFYWWVGPTDPIVWFTSVDHNLRIRVTSTNDEVLGEMHYKRIG